MKVLRFLIPMGVSLPIWFYLTYHVLLRVDATELMWFLFWIYVPAVIFSLIVSAIFEMGDKK